MIRQRPIRRILLIRRRALGDALVTLPAIADVRRAWPRARIDLVMDRPFAGILADLEPDVRVLTYPAPDGRSWLSVLRGGRYDLVLDWLSTPQTALWTVVTGAPLRVGYALRRRWWAYNIRVPRNREGDYELRSFAGESFLDPLREMGLVPDPWRDGVACHRVTGPRDTGFGEWLETWTARPGPRLALVMSATWSAKAWPVSKIAVLVQMLIDAGYDPLLVPGPGDDSMMKRLRDHVAADRFAPPTNLAELADLLDASDLFVGTDCGARHLAAALAIPTVTIFGPTDSGGWNPASPDHVAVRVGVDCSPCDLTICPLPNHPCMTELAPESVRDAAQRILERRREGRNR